jgi:hypothetical protein
MSPQQAYFAGSSTVGYSPYQSTLSIDSGTTLNGYSSLEVTGTAGGTASILSSGPPTPGIVGNTYYGICSIKLGSPSHSTAITFAMFAYNGTTIGSEIGVVAGTANASTWTQFAVSGVLPSGYNGMALSIGNTGTTSGDIWYLNAVQISMSSTAPWNVPGIPQLLISGTSISQIEGNAGLNISSNGTGVLALNAATVSSGGAISAANPLTLGSNHITFGSAAPTTGTWVVGDVCFNTGVTATTSPGWSCTTAGTPGTWTAWPNL